MDNPTTATDLSKQLTEQEQAPSENIQPKSTKDGESKIPPIAIYLDGLLKDVFGNNKNEQTEEKEKSNNTLIILGGVLAVVVLTIILLKRK